MSQSAETGSFAPRFLLALILALPLLCASACADELERVVILSRHNVRAPNATGADLARYTGEVWPEFSAPRGQLTANGRALEGLLGSYYHRVYQSLLPAGKCDALYVHANVLERTVETGRALAETLEPGCAVVIHTVGDGKVDPLFDAVGAGIAHPDYDLALAAVAGRVGNDPEAWARVHGGDLQALQDLIGDKGQKLSAVPSSLSRGAESNLVQVDGPFVRASTLSESLLMAYADGLSLDRLTGGRLTEQRLIDAQAAHVLDLDMQLRAPYIGKVTASHLAERLAATLQGTAAGIGGGKSPVIAVIGHDGTLLELASLLDLHWLLPGYQPDQVPPGGALRFELWRRGDGAEIVRLSFTAQSLTQLRERLPLTAERPPATVPVFIPGCSEATPSYDCPLDRLVKRIDQAIDPAFSGR
ncbi:MAG TPA: histidine-type phosphatase [Magnetospirillaceae bacterium]|nr:histidine-type phosphatase [Magnetospirillaceae bacterium]